MHDAALPTAAREVLDFWFGDEDVARPEWFRKDPAFDAAIRGRFRNDVEAAQGVPTGRQKPARRRRWANRR